MKKLLIIAAVFLASCSKEKSVCWDCTFGPLNGITRPAETICNDGEDPGPFEDAEGNDLSSFCQKK